MAGDGYSRTIPLSKTTKFIVDNRGRTAPTVEFGIPLIATNCISNDRLYPAYEKLRYVSQETYDTWFRSHPQPGDIILTNKGSQNGAICLVPNQVDFVIAQDMVALRADKEIIDPLFLFATLRSPDVQRQIKNLDVSGVIPHFKKTDFDKLHLPFPDRPVQEAIGHIYFDFCDKIELNRRMNATLEAMARALFQSWFVDFDPVRAKLDGRQPAGMDKATAALFPDGFEKSESGFIPKGWTIRELADVIDVKHGFAFEGKYFCDEPIGDILLTPGNFAIGGGFKDAKVKYYKGPVPEDFVLSNDDLVLTMTDLSKAADTLGYPAIIPPPPFGYRYLHNQRLGKVIISKPKLATPLFLYHVFCSAAYRHEILAGATGTTVKHTSPTRIRAFKTVFPSTDVLDVFENQARPWHLCASQNEAESRNLATLRDALLPKLLSGELRVTQAR